MTTTQVKYMDIYLDVKGNYTPKVPQTYHDPGEDALFECITVSVEGVDITELLDEEQITDIEILAAENFE